jgi:hypothetical protein
MYRDVNFESAVNFAHDIVRIPSISGDEGAVAPEIERHEAICSMNFISSIKLSNHSLVRNKQNN